MDIHTAHALVRFGLRPPRRRTAAAAIPPPGCWISSGQPDPAPVSTIRRPRQRAWWRCVRTARPKPPPGESRAAQTVPGAGVRPVGNAVTTPAPFRERLVWFWTNHFTVSLRRGDCAAVAAAFVEEAIRPHVTGRFGDMLLAVMRHPAMLLYLDNAAPSVPTARSASARHRGLNENLARECLELHTVSPLAGYTQADVTAFANILTGWSVDLKADPPGFRYRPVGA